ncbi:MAG: NAD-dependent epimerase/dehydratase family protein [Kiritimatiellia bacterium]
MDDISTVLVTHVALLKGLRILLTGGTGFLGKWLLHTFIQLRKSFGLNSTLTVLSRDPKGFLDSCPEFVDQPGLDLIAGDVRSFTPPAGRTFDFVIHGATATSAKLDQDDPEEMYSVITEGTRHLLDFARRCEARRLLYISSGAVYGTQQPGLNHIPETFEGVPITAYGRGKKASEQLCLDASAGHFECVIARPFAFVGPYLPLDTHFAIGNFIRDCLENRPIIIRGDGTPLRSYLYAADLAEWLWTLLLRGEHGRAYNVGAEDAISIRDLACLVRECAGTQNEIRVQEQAKEGVLPARYVPSVDRVRHELGLTPRCSLSDAILRTIAWHRNVKEEGEKI